MALSLSYTIQVKCPSSDEEVEADCYFYYIPYRRGNYLNPDEPVEVELFALYISGVNVIKDFSFAQLLKIEGELLEYVLQLY